MGDRPGEDEAVSETRAAQSSQPVAIEVDAGEQAARAVNASTNANADVL